MIKNFAKIIVVLSLLAVHWSCKKDQSLSTSTPYYFMHIKFDNVSYDADQLMSGSCYQNRLFVFGSKGLNPKKFNFQLSIADGVTGIGTYSLPSINPAFDDFEFYNSNSTYVAGGDVQGSNCVVKITKYESGTASPCIEGNFTALVCNIDSVDWSGTVGVPLRPPRLMEGSFRVVWN